MVQKFIILRIFKCREKKKTRLKSDFGLFYEVIGNKIIYTDYNGPKSSNAYKSHEVTLNEISAEVEFIHVGHRR